MRRRSVSDSASSAARFDATQGNRVDLFGQRNELGFERASLGGQIDMDFLAARRAWPARDVSQFFHGVERRERGRLHDSGLVAQLPLRESFGLPQNAQEGPVPIRDRVFGEPHLQGAGKTSRRMLDEMRQPI